MAYTLSNLKPNKGANRAKKRVGRGHGCGTGTNAGRGQKGQKHRSGHHYAPAGFEGGQMPMQRRLPKRGFTNIFRIEADVVNVSDLAKRFDDGATVDVEALTSRGMVPRKTKKVKILGFGDLSKKLTIKVHSVSATAKEKIEKAGGSVESL